MAEQQIAGFPDRAAPNSRVTKDSETFELLAVNASFDGSAAAADFVPAVEVVSDAGRVVGRFPAESVVAAGDSAEVTFAPFLKTMRGFIRYDVTNVGDSLYVEATGSSTRTSGYGMKFVAPEGFVFESVGAGGNFTVTLSNQWFVTALDIDFIGTGSHVTDFGGQSSGNHNSATYAGDFTLQAATGITLETTNTPVGVLTHGGDVTIDPDGGAIALGKSPLDFVGFFGATPVQQQPTPVTLADVIALLYAYGLTS